MSYDSYLTDIHLNIKRIFSHDYSSFIFLVRTLREDGTECQPGEVGRLVAKLPLPPGFASTLWQADERFKKIYFETYPVRYLAIYSYLGTIHLSTLCIK